MNPLCLDGYGIKLRVRNLKTSCQLEIQDGHDGIKQRSTMRFRPRKFPFGSILVNSTSGYVSFRALDWISRNSNASIFFVDVKGGITCSVLPRRPVRPDLRFGQFIAASDRMKTFTIGKAIIEAKVERSLELLKSISERYDIHRELQRAHKEATALSRARTVSELRLTEARVASEYWKVFQAILPQHVDFSGRLNETTHQFDASDAFNATLNFGYAILESECRRSVNAIGLEPAIGFVHPPASYQIKEGFVFDVMEVFRWIIDLTALQAFESGLLDIKDFFFTGDDYSYRFEVEAKRRFVEAIKRRFNSGIKYKGRHFRWDSLIGQKLVEFSRFLVGKSQKIDFTEPRPNLHRSDNLETRRRILSLTQKDADRIGVGRSTLHYLREHARDERSFRINCKVKAKIEQAQHL